MTSPDEARAQARRLVDATPGARERVERAAIRWRLRVHYPAVTRQQQDEDFNAREAANEAEQGRKR